MRNYNPFLLADFYKISHRHQYPEGTEGVYSTWIPRTSRINGIDGVVTFGLGAFLEKWIPYFKKNFFDRSFGAVEYEYKRIIRYALGDMNPDTSHLEYLWQLQYLPLQIKALPEGTICPIGVPMMTIENTDKHCFWLTNALETLISCEIWQPATSATLAHHFRQLLNRYAIETTGSTEGVEFQSHDFSMRGMENVDAAAASGAGHLLSFRGTDSIPSILYLEKYYGANVEKELVGASVPASEHSVMCAYGKESEYDAYKRFITELYPSGIVSIVSDTYDLWKVLTKTLPSLHNEIMARDGKLTVRPDSGDPGDIICGIPDGHHLWMGNHLNTYSESERKGVIELLWDEFGGTVNEHGYKVLDPHVGAIYGDAITYDRAKQILSRLREKGFASTNILFGVGSYTYQYQTRDTFGFALKSTWVQVGNEERNIFKDPITDTKHTKKSLTGRVIVEDRGEGLVVRDGLSWLESHDLFPGDHLRTVFEDGTIYAAATLSRIRKRLSSE